MKHLLSRLLKPAAAALACAAALATPAWASSSYTVAGPAGSITPASGSWAWDQPYISDLRGALENPANFGPAGIVQRSISTVTIDSFTPGALAGVNMFVATWLDDGDLNAEQVAAVTAFFLGGGDLFLLQDDNEHDVIGEALGLSTFSSTGSVSNGGAPLYSGPFGTATNVTQHYNVGRLEESDVLALGGTVAGRNAEGEVTSAYWRAGEFAPGAGALFINADIDMVATTSGCSGVCGASYSPLNNNGIFALNTFAFIQGAGGTPPIPEPGTYALFGLGLAAVLASVRRRRAG